MQRLFGVSFGDTLQDDSYYFITRDSHKIKCISITSWVIGLPKP